MMFRRSIFVTGFPGFIAARLVERLANSETQFFLLVEERFLEQAMERVSLIAETALVPPENFALVAGDITQSDLGISGEDLETILFETTDVFHLAAVYDLAVEKDLAFRVNLEGTKNVNSFAQKVSELRRYNYISTCYVAGRREGRIAETELEHTAGFRNYYEETKYLAEVEVERLKAELPVTIYRPAVVVGDSKTGETAKYDGIYHLIRYLRKAPMVLRVLNVGNPKVRLNLVPVDFVVDAIAALSTDKAAVGRTLALADPSPLTTAELFDVIAEDLTGRRSEFNPSPQLTEWFLNTRLSPVITGLPRSGVPYFFLPQTYDTASADKLLAPHGIKCPRFGDYVDKLTDFVEHHPEL